MTDHLVPVGVALGLVPTHNTPKETLITSFAVASSLDTAKLTQLLLQCLRFVCLAPYTSSSASVVTVLCIQRLNRLLSATIAVIFEVGAMSTSAPLNMMKVRRPEPAEIEYKNMKFLITYRPTDATMDRFIEV